MLEFANWLFGKLSPLNKPKNAQLAAFLGFLFGGLGLGLYFLSFIDFLIPILIVLLLSTVLTVDPQTAWLFGAIVAALWGYLRVLDSNSRMAVT